MTVRRGGRRHLPVLEGLEDRTVLSPTIYTVTGWGDSSGDPHTSTSGDLRYCIGLANANIANPNGSLIQFDSSVFNVARTITLASGLTFSNTATPTTINGTGVASLMVSGGGLTSNFSVFTVNSGATATISALTIENGHTSGNGGGVWNLGTVVLTYDTLSGNSANYGGGMLNIGTATLSNVSLSGNSATYGGGVYSYSSTATLTNVTLAGNSATYEGGGFNNYSATVTMNDVTISGNSAGTNGGGVWNNVGATAALTNVTLSGNSATLGGGMFNGSTATLNEVTFAGNSAAGSNSYGGAMYTFSGSATLTNVTLSANTAGGAGGGICTDVSGTVTLTNVTLSGNTVTGANGSGGGIYNGSMMTLTNATLSGNSASNIGGGMLNHGTATLTQVTLASNSATYGGGIYNYSGTATLTNVTLSGNTAVGAGGGVCNDVGGTATLTNVTLSGNALTAANGGGGGIYNGSSTAMLNNTIVANSLSGGDVVGTVSGHNNLIDDAAHAGGLVNGVNGNLVGFNPLLGTLGNYGGPTQILPLLPGSPAIDRGSASISGVTVPTLDQRGAVRGPTGLAAGSNPDIGAYEASSSYVVTNTADTTAVGTLRCAVDWANLSNNPNSAITPNTIAFQIPTTDPGYSGGVWSIALASGLTLSNMATPTTIIGTGVSSLTVLGGGPSSNFSVFTVNSGTTVSVAGLTIANGYTSGNGGGIGNYGTITVTNVTLAGNSAQFGGGINNVDTSSTATLMNVTLSGNSADSGGGGVSNGGKATLTNVTIFGNSASNIGGGVGSNGTMTLTNVTFSGNTAQYGGGVGNYGTMTLTNVTLSGNSANYGGGGVSNAGTMTLINVALTGNSASNGGGGVGSNGTMTLTNVTLSGNSAPYGGGVDNYGTITLTNVTLSGNSASTIGGNIYINSGDTATLNNTIVANSLSGGDVFGTVSGHDNLIDTAVAGGLVNGVNGNLVGFNPLLGTLGNYGGPTQTLPLLPGSPAIDAGNNTFAVDGSGNPLTIDQRGLARVVGTAVDIGAFESSGFTLTVTAGNNQTARIGTAFPTGLLVTVTPKNAGDPLNGGTVTFTAPPTSGASAMLVPASPVTIAGGSATVNATANSTVGGPYTITTSTTGEVTPASFSLTNSAPLITSLSIAPSVSSPSYGQSLSFTLTAAPDGTGAPVPTGTVQFKADGVALGAPVIVAAGRATSILTSGLSAGSHTITALYSGDTSYLANSAGVPLVLTKAHLTVTANTKSMVYGGSVPALTATISGFVNGDTSNVVSGTPGLSTSANSAIPVGAYTITVAAGTLSAANYDFPNLVNGTLTINQAHLTVTADSQSKFYGDSVPALTATISGFVNGDTSNVVSGTPGLSTSANSASPVGAYTITVAAGSLSAANYDFPNLLSGSLTVNKAHLTVTANTKSMVYGGSVPTLTATFSGFVNGDTSNVVSGTPGLSTSVSSASPVGAYTITVAAESLSAANYDFPNLVNSTLTVNRANLTVTADAKNMVYGGSAPALTATFSGFVNGDTFNVVSGTPGLSTSATSASPVASYTITVTSGSLSAANYDFPNLVNGTLTVNKAHLSVTAETKSVLYGGLVPALTATISGFVNGETSSVVSGCANS